MKFGQGCQYPLSNPFLCAGNNIFLAAIHKENDMFNKGVSLFLLLLVSCFVCGQILPAPGAKLNYTQIMFEHPKVYGADEYIVQVDTDKNMDAFAHRVAEG